MARNSPTPPSLIDPPDWLAGLRGFDLFNVQRTNDGWTAMPQGVDETVEFPGGTWRAVLHMPADLTITTEHVDPLVLLVTLANGSAKVEDKIQELVAFCRSAGKSWSQIGQALGMTKQSAWEKFSGED